MKNSISVMILTVLLFNSVNVLISLNPCKADSNIIYVDDDGDGNYTNIQNAIEYASIGDTVFVYNGTYYENIVINKAIVLEGEDKNTTFINGSLTGDIIHIIANGVNISGFTIEYSGNVFPDAGINISSDYNTISGNIMINNFYGMTMFSANKNIISDNFVSNNDHCGIYMSGSSNNKIYGNIIKYHQYNGIGMYDSTDNNMIFGNTMSNNDFCGINIRQSSNNNITQNNLVDNNIGIHNPGDRYSNQLKDNNYSNNNIDVENDLGFTFITSIAIVFVVVMIIFFVLFSKRKKQP